MSEGRESLSPFVMIRLAIRFRRWPKKRDYRRTLHPRNLLDRTWWQDTFGPVACWIRGHNHYDTSLAHERPEWACRRCNRYVEAPR